MTPRTCLLLRVERWLRDRPEDWRSSSSDRNDPAP